MLIGEVARRSGVSARMLRHYESLGLLRPAGRSRTGYREYTDEDLRRIFHIESLRAIGLSLREVGRALEDPGFTPSGLIADLIRRSRERIAQETELLARLDRIGAAGPADWPDVLQVVALLHALGSDRPEQRQRAALASGAAPPAALVEAALAEPDPNVAGALRWALAQSGDAGARLLAGGLDSPRAEVRQRAVRALAEFGTETATVLLGAALGSADLTVRRQAALALGPRGVAETTPILIDMVVHGVNDVEAGDALAVLAGDPVRAGRITAGLVACLRTGDAPMRRRVAQALAGIPGATATHALAQLSGDDDRGVALTAAYVLQVRGGR